MSLNSATHLTLENFGKEASMKMSNLPKKIAEKIDLNFEFQRIAISSTAKAIGDSQNR